MNMTFRTFPLSLLWLAALVSPASAQTPPVHFWPSGLPCLPFAPENTIDWPTSLLPYYGSPASFGRLVVADLDGDQAPEGVITASGIAVALWKLGVYDAPQLVHFPTQAAPTVVADLATLRG